MESLPLLDRAGRRRSPAPFHTGLPPRNKGLRYPPDPPTVDEHGRVRGGETLPTPCHLLPVDVVATIERKRTLGLAGSFFRITRRRATPISPSCAMAQDSAQGDVSAASKR